MRRAVAEQLVAQVVTLHQEEDKLIQVSRIGGRGSYGIRVNSSGIISGEIRLGYNLYT